MALAGDDELRKLDDSGGKREERRRARVERSGRVVDRAIRRTVHRTPSSLAEDVVNEALHSVGRQLLMRDDEVRQSDTPQSRYSTSSLRPSSAYLYKKISIDCCYRSPSVIDKAFLIYFKRNQRHTDRNTLPA